MTEADQRAALWEAVNQITQPTSRKLQRDPNPEWVTQLADDPTITVCNIKTYRAATTTHAKIPPLWQQAEWALTTGSEPAEGGGQSPLRERSIADLDLMETMLTIRETITDYLARHHLAARTRTPHQLRQVAAHVVTHQPDQTSEWAYRAGQWARILAAHVQAAEHGPRPVRLRNSPCPRCGTRQVVIRTTDGPQVVPPLLIDFVGGAIRAATCTACHATWWRGDQLNDLADLLATDTPTHPEVAHTG